MTRRIVTRRIVTRRIVTRRAAAPRAEAGFTLLELLVAVTLLSFLTAIAYGGVRFGSLSWSHAGHRSDTDAEQAAVVRVLRQSLARAYPAYASTDPADPTIAFAGDAGTLTLTAPLPDAIEPGVMAVERFRIAEDGVLVMEWRPDLPLPDLPSSNSTALPLTATPLAAGIDRIRFGYFGRPRPDAAAWFDQWTGMRLLPELVHVQVWRRTAAAAWVDITVATTTTTNTECVYDPSDLNCRRSR